MDLTKVNHTIRAAYTKLDQEIRQGRIHYANQTPEWKETTEAALYLEQINRRLTAHKSLGVILFTQQLIK